MHVNMVQGDFIYAQWLDEDMREFEKKKKELVSKGFEKVGVSGEFQDAYFTYRKEKEEIVLTIMCF